MARPAFRVKTARKDGNMQSYTTRDGDAREAKSISVGALWDNEKYGGYNLTFDAAAIEADPRLKSLSEDYYFNIYPVDDGPADGGGGLLD